MVRIKMSAVEAPVRQIAENSGAEGSIVVGKLREKSDLQFGWNAQTGEYGDLFAMGVIDPAKVVRTALQDAASVAGLLITTEAMIAEKPKKEASAAPCRCWHGLLTVENEGSSLIKRASNRRLWLRCGQHFPHRRYDASVIIRLAEKPALDR